MPSKITAGASGIRATCASNNSSIVAPGMSRAVSFQCASPRRSAGVRTSKVLSGRAGAAAAWPSSRVSRAASASMVAWSNRSAAYSKVALIPAGAPRASRSWANARVKSNLAAPAGTGSAWIRSPGSCQLTAPTSSSASMTWNSGCRDGDRAGFSTSTSRSNGTSWRAWAASTVSRTRPTSSANPGSLARSARSTSVFTKNPTRSSSASSVRPATGAPTGISAPAPSRDSTATSPASTTMNTVA